MPSSQVEERQGPLTSKKLKINIVRAGMTTLYTHAPQLEDREPQKNRVNMKDKVHQK
jgi:hypothetical protein